MQLGSSVYIPFLVFVKTSSPIHSLHLRFFSKGSFDFGNDMISGFPIWCVLLLLKTVEYEHTFLFEVSSSY